ncbi:MAG: hypothetical protein ACPGRD_08835 [Planktomarina sp.]
MIDWCPKHGNIAVVKVTRPFPGRSIASEIRCLVDHLTATGCPAALVDFQELRLLNAFECATVLECFVGMTRPVVGVVAKQRVYQKMVEFGLDRILPIFPNIGVALADPLFSSRVLAGHRAIVLCGKGIVAQGGGPPFDATTPIGEQSSLQERLDHLALYGILDVIFVVSDGDNKTRDFILANKPPNMSVFFRSSNGTSYAQLSCAFDMGLGWVDDVIVLNACGWHAINLSLMIEKHKTSCAGITICNHESSNLDFFGAAVVSSGAMAHANVAGFDETWPSFVGSLFSADVPVAYYDSPTVGDVSVASGFFAAQADRSRTLPRDTFAVKSNAFVTGPVLAATGAIIEDGARVIGPVILEADAKVCAGAFVSNSWVASGCELAPQSWTQNMLIGRDWAIDHVNDSVPLTLPVGIEETPLPEFPKKSA